MPGTSRQKRDPPSHAIILCHPAEHSFNGAIAGAYADVALENGHQVVLRDLYRIDFDPVLKACERPPQSDQPFSPDVAAEIGHIGHADAFVLVYPVWFGTPPAMMVGYIERVFGAGFSHRDIREEKKKHFLTGKRLLSITTSGNSGPWFNEHGAERSLCNLVDRYLESAFGMADTKHLHLGSIVSDMGDRKTREELCRVRQFASDACAQLSSVSRSR